MFLTVTDEAGQHTRPGVALDVVATSVRFICIVRIQVRQEGWSLFYTDACTADCIVTEVE